MNKIVLLLVSCFIIQLTACVGVDIVAPENPARSSKLMINSSIDSLKIGDEIRITASLINENGEAMPAENIIWQSLNPQQATVNEEGLVSGIATGQAIITAQYEELLDSIAFFVGENTVVNNSRQINFSGRNGYAVNGTGSLSNENEKLLLHFNSDFSADSGPGLVVYLSNSSSTVQGGVELITLKANNGSQEYDVANILAQNENSTSVDLNTFNYVIIYCKPFGVLFGVGNIQK